MIIKVRWDDMCKYTLNYFKICLKKSENKSLYIGVRNAERYWGDNLRWRLQTWSIRKLWSFHLEQILFRWTKYYLYIDLRRLRFINSKVLIKSKFNYTGSNKMYTYICEDMSYVLLKQMSIHMGLFCFCIIAVFSWSWHRLA